MSNRRHALRAVPGFHSTYPGIQIAAQTSHHASDEDLQFFQQLGIEWIMLGVEDPALQTLEHYKRFVERFAAYSIQIYRISNRRVHNLSLIHI